MADPKDIKEAKRMKALFKKLGKEIAKRPVFQSELLRQKLLKGTRGAIKVADLFAPVPGGKFRTGMRLAPEVTSMSKSAFKKLMARRTAQKEADKAALAAAKRNR